MLNHYYYTYTWIQFATSLQDCRNSKFGKIELYEPQDSPINSASFGCRVVILSAFFCVILFSSKCVILFSL